MLEKILDLKLTYKCNNNCLYCCQDRKLRNAESDMELEKIREIFDNEGNEFSKVVLTGGEPTLNENLLEIVRNIKEKNIHNIQLQTNGKRLSNINFLENIIKAGVNSFGISMHGHNAVIHEKFSGTKDSFTDVIAALENIKMFNTPIALNCVITKHNINYLQDIISFVSENKYAESLQFAFIHITGKAENGVDDYVRISEAAKRINDVIDISKKGSLKITTEAIPFCLMNKHEKNVSELFNKSQVITYDFRERRDFSNVITTTFKTKREECKKCLFYSLCEGTWVEYPEIFGFDEFMPVTEFRSEY